MLHFQKIVAERKTRQTNAVLSCLAFVHLLLAVALDLLKNHLLTARGLQFFTAIGCQFSEPYWLG